MTKNIELELRAEVPKHSFEQVLRQLRSRGVLLSKTKRLSVMYFGKVGKHKIDIRVRITDGEAEVVIKKGDFHAHNRTEVSQSIKKEQFVGMVKLMTQLGFTDVKVGERETYNFDFGNGIIVSLGRGGDISYLEIEKMSSVENQKKDTLDLMNFANTMRIPLLKNKKEFLDLCRRLTATCDWPFRGSDSDYKKLEKVLKKY